MQNDTAKHFISGRIRRRVAISNFLDGIADAHFLSHQPQQKIDIVALAEQESKLALLKWREKPLGEVSSPSDWNNTDGRVFRDTAAEYRHKQAARISGECGRTARAEPEIKGSRNVGHTREMYGLALMRTRDVHQQLLGCSTDDGFIVCANRAVKRDRRYAAGKRERRYYPQQSLK